MSKESNVPSRRAIFRSFKKFYGKFLYKNYESRIKDNLGEEDIAQLENLFSSCRYSQSAEYFRLKMKPVENESISMEEALQRLDQKGKNCNNNTGKFYDKNNTSYCSEIADPCYRYNKCVKERFFKNVYLSYMFAFFAWLGGKTYIQKQAKKQQKSNKFEHLTSL